MSELITFDQMSKALPKGVKGALTEDMVANINALIGDVKLSENYRNNLLSYTSVLNDGRYKMQSYIDAVRYVSFKLLGESNIGAYTKTFPDRVKALEEKGVDKDGMYQYSTAYNRTKLVQAITEQTLTPSYILNNGLFQKALNVQADLMVNADSEKVRTDAANSLLNHLKTPETQKIELDIGIKEDKTIDELRATTLELVAQQKAMIASKSMSVKEVAHSEMSVIEGEVI